MEIDDRLPAWVEVLDRPPVEILDATKPEDIQAEFAERLEALLAAHNGLKPTAEGWRDLALALAMKYEHSFRIETPADREGRSGTGGRPTGMRTFVLRSMMKAEMRTGKTQGQAAVIVAKKLGIAKGTANNAFSRKASVPDAWRRQRYEIVAEKAMAIAADEVSQKAGNISVTR